MMAFRKMYKYQPSMLTIIFILNYFFGHCSPQLYEGGECEMKDGSSAVCKSFVLCRWAIQGLNQRTINYGDIVRCSFEGANEIICCGDERPTPRPDINTFPIETSEDGIYFDPVTTSQRSVRITTTQRPLVATTARRPVTSTTRLPTTTTRRLVVTTITTTRRPLSVTTTTKRVVSTQRPQITSSSVRVPLQPGTFTTPTRPVTKPTVNSFWSEWSPTNDVEVFTISTTNSMIEPIKPTQNTNSSKVVMAPWLQEILNEAISSNNISSTTPRPRTFERLVQLNSGDGFNDISNVNIGESNNDISFSRPRTTEPSRVTPAPGTTPSRPPTRLGQRRSEIACENYTLLSSPFINQNIIGGVATELGEFPHMAALGYPSQEIGRFEYDFNCGGSVISENFILTAAHCVTDRNPPTVVKTGKITLLSNDDGVPGVTSTIAEIISHPNYSPSRRYDDIALIRVSSPIPFEDNYIRPACLNSNMSDIDASVRLIVMGWGKTSIERAERANVLQKTNLTGVSLESCNASLLGYNPNDRSLRNGVNLGQLCAYDPDAKHDSCEGDSGGPLQIYNPNGMSTIVGVVSFGIACGSALPSVYARVAFYLDWIESIVWPNR